MIDPIAVRFRLTDRDKELLLDSNKSYSKGLGPRTRRRCTENCKNAKIYERMEHNGAADESNGSATRIPDYPSETLLTSLQTEDLWAFLFLFVEKYKKIICFLRRLDEKRK